MKKALIEKARNRLCLVLGPVGPDWAQPVAAGFEWRDCADDVTPETHDFDGTTFGAKAARAAT